MLILLYIRTEVDFLMYGLSHPVSEILMKFHMTGLCLILIALLEFHLY